MAIAPPIVLGAPPTNKAASRYSLLDAAVGPLDMPDGARLADLAYTVPWCGPGGAAYVPECEVDKTPEGPLDIADGLAVTVERGFTCLAPGLAEADVARIMADRLEVSEPVLVEKALAGFLGASTPTDLGSAGIVAAVSAMETHAYTTEEYGLTAVMHLPAGAFAYLADAGQLVRESSTGIWRTLLGTIAAPNVGLTDHAYVTGLTVVWRSPAPWIPDPADAFDRATNQYRMIGQRDYIVAWECFAATVELEPLVPPGGDGNGDGGGA